MRWWIPVAAALLCFPGLGLAGPPGLDSGDPAAAAFGIAVRALTPGLSDDGGQVVAASTTGDPDPAGRWGALPAHDDSIAAIFLVSGLTVAKSRLPLPPGIGTALTVYEVLDGRKSPARAATELVQGEAIDAVFAGVQAATLWFAAKALAGGSTLVVTGLAGAAVVDPVTTAPAAALIGTLPKSGLVAAGTTGLAGITAAAVTAAATWSYRRYQDETERAERMEGLFQGAERRLSAR